MAEKDELITADDFVSLKKLVSNEISRRSTSNSVGSMSNYNGSNYQYTVSPASGKKITYEHIQKITAPLDAIDGGSLTPEQGTLVYADILKNALIKVRDFSSKTQTNSNTGCRSSCTGLCSTGCYGTCTGCDNTCSGGCKNSCDGCKGDCDGCKGSCTSCTGSCDTFCTGTCEGGCTGCSGWCKGNGCGTSCAGNCGYGLNS